MFIRTVVLDHDLEPHVRREGIQETPEVLKDRELFFVGSDLEVHVHEPVRFRVYVRLGLDHAVLEYSDIGYAVLHRLFRFFSCLFSLFAGGTGL